MEERLAALKDGREVTLRSLAVDDKERLLTMFSSMSESALRWGMPPYTRDRIERWFAGIQDMIGVVALDGDRIVGGSMIFRQASPRRKSIGDLIIYLHQGFHGVGLGTAITKQILALAQEQGMHRIGLEVVEDNKVAVHLYSKFGFKTEGKLKDSYFGGDNRYHNTLIMGKILRQYQTVSITES
jgi:putative acetyltransferase